MSHLCSRLILSSLQRQRLIQFSSLFKEITKFSYSSRSISSKMSYLIEERGCANSLEYRLFYSKSSAVLWSFLCCRCTVVVAVFFCMIIVFVI